MSCAETITDLSPDEALLIVEPYFEAEKEIFLERGMDRVTKTRLSCRRSAHDSARHFGACRDDGKLIVVAPEIVELPDITLIGILAHELGHAVDFLYPAEFYLGPDGVNRRDRETTSDTQWIRWTKSWEMRDPDVVELTADAICEYVTGAKIGYGGPCQLQRIGEGAPRPVGLR